MASHSDLTGAGLHEPKGAQTASNGTVYVSDGSGSGSWTTVSGAIANVVNVTSAANLPDPVGDEITLENDTVYRISGSVDLTADRIICGTNNVIMGTYGEVDALITAHASPLITSTSNLLVVGLELSNTSGDIFDVSGGGTLTLQESRILTCDSVGTFDACPTVRIENCSVTATTVGGFDFTGTSGNLYVHRVTTLAHTLILWNLGSSTWDQVVLDGVTGVMDNAAETWLEGIASSANINSGGRGVVRDCFVTDGGGTVLNNIAASDARWYFTDNEGTDEEGEEFFICVVIPDVSTADELLVPIPKACRLVHATTALEGAITGVDSIIDFKTAADSSLGTGATIAYSGSAAGDIDVFTPTTNDTFAVDSLIKVITDGASGAAQRLWVTLLFVGA